MASAYGSLIMTMWPHTKTQKAQNGYSGLLLSIISIIMLWVFRVSYMALCLLGPVATNDNSQLLRQFCANQGGIDAACPKASKEMPTQSGAKLTKRWLLAVVATGPR